MKMLRLLAIASVLAAVSATNYAYVGNNLIEYEDPPKQSISIPYPYPKNEQRSQSSEQVYSVSNSYEGESDSLVSFGSICSKITKIISFIKRKIVKIITSIPAIIINIIMSSKKCILSSICKHFNLSAISSLSDLSSLVTPDRLKRATEYIGTAIKDIDSL